MYEILNVKVIQSYLRGPWTKAERQATKIKNGQRGRGATSRKHYKSQKRREFEEFPTRPNITKKSSKKNEEPNTFNE